MNILVTHGMVPGLEAKQHEMGEANLQAGMLEGDFDYMALGHYHEFHKHKPNAYYAGATERFGFGEVESEPGFAIVEFDGGGLASVEHVPIETRPMLDLPEDTAPASMDAGGADGGDPEPDRRTWTWTARSCACGPTTCAAGWRAGWTANYCATCSAAA